MKSAIKLRFEDLEHTPEDGNRYEIMDGELLVSPAPRMLHQRIVTQPARFLGNHIEEHGLGEVWVAPTSVILDPWTALEPDIVYVSIERSHIVSERGIEGVPDLVIEVLSPSTADRDRTIKFHRYEQAGIPNYWIVDTEGQHLTQYGLGESGYNVLNTIRINEGVETALLPGFSVPIQALFQQPGSKRTV